MPNIQVTLYHRRIASQSSYTTILRRSIPSEGSRWICRDHIRYGALRQQELGTGLLHLEVLGLRLHDLYRLPKIYTNALCL
jgi:hypothetical protein